MKTLSVILYIIGAALLLVSCFTASVTATWWFGGSAVVALIAGCILQYNATRKKILNR